MSFGSKKDILDIEDILDEDAKEEKAEVSEEETKDDAKAARKAARKEKQEKREQRKAEKEKKREAVGEVKDYYDEDEIDRNDPVRMGEFVWSILLASIPIVNIICLCVWAFGKNAKPSKKNWARAKLIWVLVGAVIGAIIGAFVIGLLAAVAS